MVNPDGTSGPKLLSGGNPQIAKGYGDKPVQAYISAMPGWKSDIGRRIDRISEVDRGNPAFTRFGHSSLR